MYTYVSNFTEVKSSGFCCEPYTFMLPLFTEVRLTLCLPLSSADNLGKQFGPRSGPTIHRACSGSKLFDIPMVFLKEFFPKNHFEKNQQTTKKYEKLPGRQ